jgi:hypothetical protein
MIRDDSKKDGQKQQDAERKDPEGISGEEKKGTFVTLKRHNVPPSVAPGSFIVIERNPNTKNGSDGREEFSKRPTISFKPSEGINVVYIPEEKILHTIKPSAKPKDAEKDEDKES